ncbi:CRISPR-associated protein, Cas5h family [Methanosarcina lacustris Z-7289]|uniref:CRISPR-associated protein, Cas5h family n=1 Tax=Methanosarcina lacustris Z-7289 TaxID=1434111 RepID=A0A0E3WT87_9EURY|nr:type I-B CRISPR-associated protein Cas5b [Methanosarcina lacustris]AKB75790.1 CRISPR-associated protein, Cas5h family [Methanosarcina lacustris Z-7289]
MDCLVFTARGEHAMFRQPETTTSALTFSCIHPVATKGLVGAVMGLDNGMFGMNNAKLAVSRNELYESTLDMRVGIRVLKPVRKDTQNFSLVTMKSEHLFNFQSPMQFLRDVEYELFIAWDSKKLDKLETALKTRIYGITPYLGVSDFGAKLSFVKRCDAKLIENATAVDTVIPVRCIKSMKFSACSLNVETVNLFPTRNNELREYISRETVKFAFEGNRNCAINGDFDAEVYNVDGCNVYFF